MGRPVRPRVPARSRDSALIPRWFAAGNEALTSAASAICWTDGQAKAVSTGRGTSPPRRPMTPLVIAEETEMGSKNFPAIGGIKMGTGR